MAEQRQCSLGTLETRGVLQALGFKCGSQGLLSHVLLDTGPSTLLPQILDCRGGAQASRAELKCRLLSRSRAVTAGEAEGQGPPVTLCHSWAAAKDLGLARGQSGASPDSCTRRAGPASPWAVTVIREGQGWFRQQRQGRAGATSQGSQCPLTLLKGRGGGTLPLSTPPLAPTHIHQSPCSEFVCSWMPPAIPGLCFGHWDALLASRDGAG